MAFLWFASVFILRKGVTDIQKKTKKTYAYLFRCLGDLRKSTGPLVYTIFSSFIIATFIANVICYFGVWTVIMITAKQINVSFHGY